VDSGTLSLSESSDDSANRFPPRLIRALQSQRLDAPPIVVELHDDVEVFIGRGSGSLARRSEGRKTHVDLQTDDRRMSSQHASIARKGSRWILTDRESKNGCFVNGARVPTAELADGDRIEIGDTVFVFRGACERPKGPSGGIETITAEIPALRTTRPDLAASFALLRKVATSPMSVLVRGESGTGKELIARAIHDLSKRPGTFVAVNCGALPETLVESQLYGHRKGAFSGADRNTTGLVQEADGGTLFLDEIAELSERSQVTLLRMLQEGEVLPVGATSPTNVDVRIVAATHQDLTARIGDGRFREDLYARLASMVMMLPPLRERREDLGLIMGEVLRDLADDRIDELSLKRKGARALFTHRWPRNVRELRSAIELALTATEDGTLTFDHLAEDASPRGDDTDPREEPQREAIVEALRRDRGNVTAAAKRLGYSRSHFHRLMKRFDIDPANYRGS
jgi:transcriptional regulator with PAS, ATPase and Fis domain